MESGWGWGFMLAEFRDEIPWMFGAYTIHWLC